MNSDNIPETNIEADEDDLALMRLLADADPHSEPEFDAVCKQTRESWTRLTQQRRRRKKFLSYGSLATAAAILIAIGLRPLMTEQPGSESLAKGNHHTEKPRVPQNETSLQHSRDDSRIKNDDRDNAKGSPAASPAATEVAAAKAVRDQLMQEFTTALDSVDRKKAKDWAEIVTSIRKLPMLRQRDLVYGVPEIADLKKRELAVTAILDAAGTDATLVIEKWLALPKMRPSAWKHLVARSSAGQWEMLSRRAKNFGERQVLCQRFAKNWKAGGVQSLVELSREKAWRVAVGEAGATLPPESHWILLTIIDRDPARRAAAGFVLQSMPTKTIDYQLAEMIVSGRQRMAGYQALIARNTKQARQFLAMSARRADLSPALAAAWRRWNQWGPQASQWVSEIRSIEDEDDKAWQYPLRDNRFDVVSVSRFSARWS